MNDLVLIDETLWVLATETGVRIYDFDFRAAFPCRTPWNRPEQIVAVSRQGAFRHYGDEYDRLLAEGVRLVNSPEEYRRASELPGWYPLLEDLTPRSRCLGHRPTAQEIGEDFSWPVFIKGVRQTSRHDKSLSIIESPAAFERAMERYAADPILNWQEIVVRELVPLRLVEDGNPGRIPSSFEFRTFWWQGECVGAGRYWWEGRRYDWNPAERAAGLAVAREAAHRVKVPFLVVDVALTASGRWIVIECNDGQESGYAGISPIGLWQNVISRSH